MVQRYDLAALGTSAHPDNEGHFVKYEDYAALEKLYKAAIEHMVAVYNSYNSDAGPALQKLYELSGKDE